MRAHSRLISPAQIETAELPAWGRAALAEFVRRIRDERPPFPCHFARLGLTSAATRFAFVQDADEAASLDAFAATLREYVATAPELAGHTSLVAFVDRPRRHDSELEYHAFFWRTLQELHERDETPWPAAIPTRPDDARWEFCFAGMPMFALGNGPVYRARLSRHADAITLAFQPRFVFDRAFATRRHYDRACGVIRARVERYDGGQPVHPALGAYGDADAREWRQYVVPDANDAAWSSCPFSVREGARGGATPLT